MRPEIGAILGEVVTRHYVWNIENAIPKNLSNARFTICEISYGNDSIGMGMIDIGERKACVKKSFHRGRWSGG
tara:strand:- start:4 stop:222 length:219 start_codon:yes stop_codon:yes gene_type:complete